MTTFLTAVYNRFHLQLLSNFTVDFVDFFSSQELMLKLRLNFNFNITISTILTVHLLHTQYTILFTNVIQRLMRKH